MAKLSVWLDGVMWRVGWVGGDVLPGDAPLCRRGASGPEPKRPNNRDHWRACRAAAASRYAKHDRHAFWWASERAAKAAATACRAAVAGAVRPLRPLRPSRATKVAAARWAALPVATRQYLTEFLLQDTEDALASGDDPERADANRAVLAVLDEIKPTPRERRRRTA